jgi:hypothetical protein
MVFSICMTELSRIDDNLFLVWWTLLLQLICCLRYDPTIFIINYSDITHFDSLLGHVSTPYVCILKRTIDETLQANHNWILKIYFFIFIFYLVLLNYMISSVFRVRRCVLNTTLCDEVCQWLAAGLWISPGTPVSSTNEIGRYDIAEMLLKVGLNTITLTP